MPEKSKILVCVNDNDHSRVAVRFACSKAKRMKCPIELLTVIEPADYQSFQGVAEKIRREKWDEARAMLEKFADEVQHLVQITPSLNVREGRLGDEIVSEIEENSDINMIILGTSPDSPSKGSLLPYLVGKLGDELLIPMMIIPGNLTEQQIKELT